MVKLSALFASLLFLKKESHSFIQPLRVSPLVGGRLAGRWSDDTDKDTGIKRTRAPSTGRTSSTMLSSKNGQVTTTTQITIDSVQDDSFIESADTVIVGGGPAGLLSAIALAQKYDRQDDKNNNRMINNNNSQQQPSQKTKIKVFDRLSAPPSADDEAVWNDVAKFYLIGIGGRGQAALKKFGVWEEVLKRSVPVVGRKDWPPDSKEGVERIFTKEDKHVTTVVLPRDKLVGVLNQFIVDNYGDRVELNFGYEVRPVDFDHKNGKQILVRVSKCADNIARINPSVMKTSYEEQPDILCDVENYCLLEADLLIAADGTVRTFANSVEKEDEQRLKAMNPIQRCFARPFHVRRYVDDNQRVYKTVPFKTPKDWRPDVNFSARTKEGRVNFDALPANGNGDFCGVLLLRKGDAMAKENVDPTEFRKFLDDALPQFSALLDDDAVASVAKKPVSYLPGFRYAEPRLHQGNSCVILGDCAHTVKPYFGLGANSALEDVLVLSNILDNKKGDIASAVREFSKQRAGEAKALVRLSRELDRPGKAGFITFILPLILDSIFFGMAPKLFKPNVIRLLQFEEYTFQQVARRKRLDRICQISILAVASGGCIRLAQLVVTNLARVLGKSSKTVSGGIIGALLVTASLNRLVTALAPGLAGPKGKSVWANLSKKVTNSRTFLTPLRALSKDSTNGETFLTTIGNKNDKETS